MSDDECRVWTADTAMYRSAHAAILDAGDIDRMHGFARADDRVRSALATVLVRRAVAREQGIDASAVVIDRRCPRCGGPHGKPQVPGLGLSVSVSHSAAMVAVAVSPAGPVGVDVEHRRSLCGIHLASHILAAGEPLGDGAELLSYWCRKESVVKATGAGLQVPLREVVVSAADAPPRLMCYQGGRMEASMFDLDLGRDYVGAVTVLAQCTVRLSVRSADVLLSPDESVTGRGGGC